MKSASPGTSSGRSEALLFFWSLRRFPFEWFPASVAEVGEEAVDWHLLPRVVRLILNDRADNCRHGNVVGFGCAA